MMIGIDVKMVHPCERDIALERFGSGQAFYQGYGIVFSPHGLIDMEWIKML
jgi:hypothetical protein